MNKLRVIQRTTGKVGKLSLRAILDDTRLVLAGVYAYSADKCGKDAGDLCGRGKCNVSATKDLDVLLALNADAVIYTPFEADVSHVIRLLESGSDVISTNLFLNVGGIQGEVKTKLEEACRRGQSSLYITGVSPGWINAIAVALTAVCRQVQGVFISETADCSTYQSPETWLAMGMSLPKATPEVIASARIWLRSFYDAVERMATALQYKLDNLEFFIEYATASQKVDLGWFCMEKDTNAAVRAGWNGQVKGNTVVRFQLTWFLTKHLNEGWEFEPDQYHILIKGEPDVQMRLRFIPPSSWGNHEWDTMTALPAVNAIFDVASARPGILTLKDVGLPSAPAGLWPSSA